MRFAHLGLAIALLAPVPALADIGPPRRLRLHLRKAPTMPLFRGIRVTRAFWWNGRQWHTLIKSCATSPEACTDPRLPEARCFVTGVDGRVVAGGDIAALVVAERAAKNRPIRIKLEGCGDLTDIELHP